MAKMNNEPDDKSAAPRERKIFIIFCTAAAVYFAVCILIFTLADINEQNAYVDVKPLLSEKNTIPDSEKININTATLEELVSLNGIGEVTASNIIEYRDTYGGFISIDELVNVNGIGEKLLKKIRPYLTL
ncbi:MAG: helix-hairpin-helix domain-containing protein [Ruminiclostridium sp.]|nr:helix-hairpin-helix domain-containing protein [Ruminiclostridium sp.]